MAPEVTVPRDFLQSQERPGHRPCHTQENVFALTPYDLQSSECGVYSPELLDNLTEQQNQLSGTGPLSPPELSPGRDSELRRVGGGLSAYLLELEDHGGGPFVMLLICDSSLAKPSFSLMSAFKLFKKYLFYTYLCM